MSETTLQPSGNVITCAELAAMEFPPIAPEPPVVPTWSELVALEPSLADVERLAIQSYRRGDDDFRCWGKIKRAFLPLVGFTAQRYELRNSTCYDVVYDHLLSCWNTGRKS